MRRYGVLFVALSAVLGAPTGAAASCAPVTPAAAFERADLVFIGSASDSAETGFTDFDVETYFKGVGPERVHVLTGQPQENVAGSGDVHPETGSRWVVYAFTDPEWGLRIDSCGSHAIRGAHVPPARGIGAPAGAVPAAPLEVPGNAHGTLAPMLLAGAVGLLLGVLLGATIVARAARRGERTNG